MISCIVNSIKSCKVRIIVIYGSKIKYLVNSIINSLTPSLVIFDAPICYSRSNEVFLLEVSNFHLNDLYETLVSVLPKVHYVFFSAFNRFLSLSPKSRRFFSKFKGSIIPSIFLRELRLLSSLTSFNRNSLKLVFLPPVRCICRDGSWLPLPLFYRIFKFYSDLIIYVKDDCVLQVKPELKSINLKEYSFSEEDLAIRRCLSSYETGL